MSVTNAFSTTFEQEVFFPLLPVVAPVGGLLERELVFRLSLALISVVPDQLRVCLIHALSLPSGCLGINFIFTVLLD